MKTVDDLLTNGDPILKRELEQARRRAREDAKIANAAESRMRALRGRGMARGRRRGGIERD